MTADAPNQSDASRPGGGPLPFTEEDLSGRCFVGCKVERKIGQGAMGAVYLAEQEELRRKVAIKVLDPKFSRDITYIERFEREAQSAALLGHFNIVQVFDYGRDGEAYYIINEFIDGGDVQKLIDAEGVLSPEQAVDITLQSCRGLSVAEENGVIHRDIKPENLMLTTNGIVKIADFGLAKVVSSDAAVTQSGMIVGTPFYMSPEQAKGLELDTRSDIYSLGVSFFHMVTGQLPFDAESVIGVLLKQISAERPDPVGINPSLPVPIGQTIMKMMARDRSDRFQTCNELIAVLEAHKADLSGGPAKVSIEVPRTPAQRRDRYKRLRQSNIVLMKLREVSSDASKQMLGLLKSDAGVFIETDAPYPENSIIELRFTVSGREGLFRGLGVVRWVEHGGAQSSMGVTFLKVSAVASEDVLQSGQSRRIKVRTPARPQARPLTPAEAIKALTKTPLHCRLLRYYYANTGQTVRIQNIANALGVGTRMPGDPLGAYEQLGMIIRHPSGLVELIWPDDRALQKEIVAWVSKYGLL